jgi:hypothetical protein
MKTNIHFRKLRIQVRVKCGCDKSVQKPNLGSALNIRGYRNSLFSFDDKLKRQTERHFVPNINSLFALRAGICELCASQRYVV